MGNTLQTPPIREDEPSPPLPRDFTQKITIVERHGNNNNGNYNQGGRITRKGPHGALVMPQGHGMLLRRQRNVSRVCAWVSRLMLPSSSTSVHPTLAI